MDATECIVIRSSVRTFRSKPMPEEVMQKVACLHEKTNHKH